MAFNRKAKLRDNIEAIRTAFELDKAQRAATPDERERLARFCGFGGLKCILNPASDLTDAVQWAKSDLELFPMTAELHRLIRENSVNDGVYKRYIDSLKSSVLTAFYTPTAVTEALADVLHDYHVRPRRLLEPSAGHGAFVDAFARRNADTDVMAFEKDLLTGKILSHLYPDKKVRTEGFERIEKPFEGYFDVTASNIPFGDVAVFDPVFSASEAAGRRAATKAIHNYFFLKGLDAVRDGGIVAFITSQGVLNSPQNEEIRREMLRHADPISVIRLPNNLFTDNAGTEVGSDLIILQKNARKERFTEQDHQFFNSVMLESGVIVNGLFLDRARIVHTKAMQDTDPYGKPAMVYLHEGGAEGIGADLRRMLSEDFYKRLDMGRYMNVTGTLESIRRRMQQPETVTEQELREERPPQPDDFGRTTVADGKKQPTQTTDNDKTVKQETASPQMETTVQPSVSPKEEKPEIEPPVMSLYDLFGFTEEERRVAQTGGKPRLRSNRPKLVQPRQPSLFDTPMEAVATAKAEQSDRTTQTTAAPVYPVENTFEKEHQQRVTEVERQMREDESKLTAEERQRKRRRCGPNRSRDYWSRTTARDRSSR